MMTAMNRGDVWFESRQQSLATDEQIKFLLAFLQAAFARRSGQIVSITLKNKQLSAKSFFIHRACGNKLNIVEKESCLTCKLICLRARPFVIAQNGRFSLVFKIFYAARDAHVFAKRARCAMIHARLLLSL